MNQKEIIETSNCLLEIGCLLMESVTSTHRIRVALECLGDCLGYGTEILITHRTVCGNVNLYFLEMSVWLAMTAV